MERLRHQQQRQQAQQPRPHEESEQDWVGAVEEDESMFDQRSGPITAAQRMGICTSKATREEHAHPVGRHAPSPEQPELSTYRSRETSSTSVTAAAAAAAAAVAREHHRESPPLEGRRGSTHSSCTGSKASVATSAAASAAAKVKYQAYPGQAALAYNLKTAAKSTYLHGTVGVCGFSEPGRRETLRPGRAGEMAWGCYGWLNKQRQRNGRLRLHCKPATACRLASVPSH